VVAATLRNDAGIIGAAIVAAEGLVDAATTRDDLPEPLRPEAAAEA
jgi:predicted regulator of Ras-like GTPase activity (Roadblock/LC7/MglB family)